MSDNYRQIAEALPALQRFNGNSASGMRSVYGPNGDYVVRSYATVILRTDDAGRVLYFDNRRYSNTTSRLQTMIRAAFPEATGGHSDRVVYEYERATL